MIILWLIIGAIVGGGIIAIIMSTGEEVYSLGKIVNKSYIASHWAGDSRIPDKYFFIIISNNQSKKIEVTDAVYKQFKEGDFVIINL